MTSAQPAQLNAIRTRPSNLGVLRSLRLATTLACCLWAGSIPLRAQMVVHVVNPDAAIPDGNESGLGSSFNLSSPSAQIQSVRVDLVIAGVSELDPAFNGDFYAQLTHTDSHGVSAMAVLLNRTGRQAGLTQGYSDAGFNVTFSDNATQGDVHAYRHTVSGSHTTALDEPGILTGIWQPDGRQSNPATVLAPDTRTAMLSAFTGLDIGGTWTLFVADVVGGGQGKLASWGVTVTPVPEPAVMTALCALLLAGWSAGRRRCGR